jgi:hypothetical protein
MRSDGATALLIRRKARPGFYILKFSLKSADAPHLQMPESTAPALAMMRAAGDELSNHGGKNEIQHDHRVGKCLVHGVVAARSCGREDNGPQM